MLMLRPWIIVVMDVGVEVVLNGGGIVKRVPKTQESQNMRQKPEKLQIPGLTAK